MSNERFSDYLEQCFLNWQSQYKKRKTLREFSEYLNVDRPILSMWMNGTIKPGPKYVDQLAQKLGPEVYDILDLPRPDPLLSFINANWDKVPQETQQDIFNQINDYLAKQEEEFKKPLRGASETSTA